MASKTAKKGKGGSKADKPPAAPHTMAKTGYGNPPKHTQFKKGQSGNKKGRPPGSKNLSTLIMAAARDEVTATIRPNQQDPGHSNTALSELTTFPNSKHDDQVDSTVNALAWSTQEATRPGMALYWLTKMKHEMRQQDLAGKGMTRV